jgi:hypothetical protein
MPARSSHVFEARLNGWRVRVERMVCIRAARSALERYLRACEFMSAGEATPVREHSQRSLRIVVRAARCAAVVDSGPWSTLKLCLMRSPRLFHVLRRHRAGLGRLVLAWFALAAATAGAAPCFAMSLGVTPAAQHEVADTHGAASGHSHSATHDHAVRAAPADHSPVSPCPHCPLAATISGDPSTSSHSFCASGDDTADGGKAGVALPSFKYVPPGVILAPPPIDPGNSRASRQRCPGGAAASAVALNLRYCVLLI